jgi:ribosome-associated protein
MSFTSRQLALHAARLASDKGATDIAVIQLPAIAGTAFDYVVLATATSDRQTNAVVEEIFHFCKRHGVNRMPVEGESGWMLIDGGDVVVHAQSAEMRARYDLDHLWPTGKLVKAWEAEANTLGDPDKPAAAPRRAESANDESGPGTAPKRRRAAARVPVGAPDPIVESGVLPTQFEKSSKKVAVKLGATPKAKAKAKQKARLRTVPKAPPAGAATLMSIPLARMTSHASPVTKARAAAKAAAKPAASRPAAAKPGKTAVKLGKAPAKPAPKTTTRKR